MHASYLIERPPKGKITGKVDMTRGYMKEDIDFSIFLLSRVMGLSAVRHLSPFMVNFIETIKMAKIPLD